MRPQRAVQVAAAAAVLARFPSLLWPLRPDEAGFLLVARSWHPSPDSVYGTYFVDRPPLVIALVKATDALGGPYLLRLVAALGCGLAVLLAAACAREIARHARFGASAALADRAAIGTAVLVAALLANPQIDAIAAKGEILGVPVLLAGHLCALRALRLRSPRWAFAAGLVGATALGLKQSLLATLVLGAVLLVGARLGGRIGWAGFGRLAGAAAAGAAVPLALTAAWALAAGVRLQTLWFTVVTFRADASRVILDQPRTAADDRAMLLLLIAATTGMVLVAGAFVFRAPRIAANLPLVGTAVALTLLTDVAGVVSGGSFWRPYLFVLVPTLALGWACAVVSGSPRARSQDPVHRPRLGFGVVAACVTSTLVSLVGFMTIWWAGPAPQQYLLGQELGRVSHPGDSMVVYGGRADVQWASGLPSPYGQLWSLPMRTLDPDLRDLDSVLEGPRAPTWLVEVVRIDAWSEVGTAPIKEELLERYTYLGTFCGGLGVYRLDSAPPVEPISPRCSENWRNVPWRTPSGG